MKKTYLLKTLALSILIFSINTVFAQSSRIALPGNAFKINDGGKYWALEVDGKIVYGYGEEMLDFTTDKGKFFVGEDEDGDFWLLDREGKEVWTREYAKISLINGTIVAYEEKDSKPRFFSQDDPKTEIVAKQVSGNFFEKQIEAKGGTSPVLAKHRSAITKAKEACALVDPIGYFELRSNERGTLDLVVDDKVLFTAADFNLATDADFYKETNCWYFIVADRSYSPRWNGTFAISMYMKDGKKQVESAQLIPYGHYNSINAVDGTRMFVDCYPLSGAKKRLDLSGNYYEVDKDKNKWVAVSRWTYDKATDKWELKPIENR